MKPHPRIRKAVKWGGAGLTVLLLVVWAASGWWAVTVKTTDGWMGRISAGGFRLGWANWPRPKHLDILPEAMSGTPVFFWRLEYDFIQLRWFIRIPLWAIAAPLAGVTAAAWRLDTLARRRARAGLCLKCGYDRAGLAPGAVCPECGAAPPAPKAKA